MFNYLFNLYTTIRLSINCSMNDIDNYCFENMTNEFDKDESSSSSIFAQSKIISSYPVSQSCGPPVSLACGTKCSICLGEIQERNSVITECDHNYCLSCLLQHLELDNKCPLCRNEVEEKRPFNYKQITYNDLMKYVEDHLESNSLSNELMTLRHSTKNSYQLLLSIMKLHMIQIGQKIMQHQYRFNDSDDSSSENEENDEDDSFQRHDAALERMIDDNDNDEHEEHKN